MLWVVQIANVLKIKYPSIKVVFDPPLDRIKTPTAFDIQYLDIRVYGHTFIVEQHAVNKLNLYQLKTNGYGNHRADAYMKVEPAIDCLEKWINEAANDMS
jgi:hypothetical protein